MSNHTASDIARADDLYDEHSIPVISEMLNIPENTMYYWKSQGWMTTDTSHEAAHQREYSDEEIERADLLYDRMPLSGVSRVLDIPEGTLKDWGQKGWISTDRCWKGHSQRGEYKGSPVSVVNEVRSTDKTQRQVAEERGLAESTVSRYMKLWRKHNL